jgi:uncharacterized protein
MTPTPDGYGPPPGAVQPPPAPGRRPPTTPARRKSAGAIVAICLGAVAVLALGLVAIVSLDRNDDVKVANTTYPNLPVERVVPQVPPSGSSAPASIPPQVAPTTSSSGPLTSSGPQKILKLADHPILQDPKAGLKNRVCILPTWQSDEVDAEAFFTAASKCLDAAWGPFLEFYHLPFTPPTLHFPTGPSFDTQCGTIGVGLATAAYYCENNLYIPFKGLQTDQYGDDPGVYLALVAHEYGHHVQEVAGIMDAAWQKIYAAGPTSPAGLEMSRRKELQAQCFSGMFLGAMVDQGGSVTRDMFDKAWNDQETRGDNTSGSHDHGTNAHYASWWRAGAKSDRIADCNTFAAPSSEVS